MRYNLELWRFVTPMFLHANFAHLCSNLLSQLVMGSMLEGNGLGFKRFACFYLLSGVGGILFSSLTSDSMAVGASTCIFGLIGYYITFMILRWNSF